MNRTDFQTGMPHLNGLYVVYVEDPITPDWGLEQLRWWQGDRWRDDPKNSGKPLVWIGPLPIYKKRESKVRPVVQEFDL